MDKHINPAVQEYYDLLFDNINFYHETIRDEIGEITQENHDLAAKLEGNEPGIDRDAITKTIAENAQLIKDRTEYLSGPNVFLHGAEISADILDDSEPELSDRFRDAPISDKYNCLVEKFGQEYKAEVHARLSQSEGSHAESDSLMTMDGEWQARKKISECFPDIDKEYHKHLDEEYAKQLKDDPVRLNANLVERYADAYVGEIGNELSKTEEQLALQQKALADHEEARPGIIDNIKSLGAAQKSWQEKKRLLSRDIENTEIEIGKLADIRKKVEGGWTSETAREHAKERIKLKHPEVIEACETHMKRHWQGVNDERLERQNNGIMERETNRDKTVRNDVSR